MLPKWNPKSDKIDPKSIQKLVHKSIQKKPGKNMPKVAKNGVLEVLCGQVGEEHVIAAHLDGEGKAFSSPSEPKRVPKEDNSLIFVGDFLDHTRIVLSEVFHRM